MTAHLVHRHDDRAVAHLTLDDPARANVLSRAMLAALRARLAEVNEDEDVRVVVLAAAGKVFCAGHDLAELRETDDRTVHRELFADCTALMRAIGAMPKPVIAQVQGAAVAAGCQLVAGCDLAFAAETARFAVSGINLGLFCSTPSVALSRMVGQKAAFEMLCTGRFIEAREAAALGLINRAVPAGELEEAVAATAAAIAAKTPRAVALGKTLFRQQLGLRVDDAYDLAVRRMADNLAFPETKQGIDGFLAR